MLFVCMRTHLCVLPWIGTLSCYPVQRCCLCSTDYLICNSLLITEIIPVVFTEENEEERLDNLFEVGEGVAPTTVLSDAESVVLSLARKCLRYHTNVAWGMLVALSYTSVQYCSTHIWKEIVCAVHQCTALRSSDSIEAMYLPHVS